MIFSKLTEMCEHHLGPVLELLSPCKFPHLLTVHPCCHPHPWAITDMLSVSLGSAFSGKGTSSNTWAGSGLFAWSLWALSCCRVSIVCSFLLPASILWMWIFYPFIHLFDFWIASSFCLQNRAPVNICVQVSVWTDTSFPSGEMCTPVGRVAGLYAKRMFTFFGDYPTVLPSGRITLHSHQQCMKEHHVFYLPKYPQDVAWVPAT